MPSHREILLATRMLFGLDEETRQAIQERIDDGMAELHPEGPPLTFDTEAEEDAELVRAIDRALESCPE